MPPTSKVELYAAIRRDARAGVSARALERKYNVGRRRTVVKALASAWPQPRKKPQPRGSKLDPFKRAGAVAVAVGLWAAAHQASWTGAGAEALAELNGRVPGLPDDDARARPPGERGRRERCRARSCIAAPLHCQLDASRR